ncbi:hypothetical protein GOODEAATRI_030430 [Goodea atripinnis]|uniref:Uncharacterized protein n=1 Tax=Goodea atripinnis TaxID=208336 RepID=A0ABV0MWG5_9TELE
MLALSFCWAQLKIRVKEADFLMVHCVYQEKMLPHNPTNKTSSLCRAARLSHRDWGRSSVIRAELGAKLRALSGLMGIFRSHSYYAVESVFISLRLELNHFIISSFTHFLPLLP